MQSEKGVEAREKHERTIRGSMSTRNVRPALKIRVYWLTRRSLGQVILFALVVRYGHGCAGRVSWEVHTSRNLTVQLYVGPYQRIGRAACKLLIRHGRAPVLRRESARRSVQTAAAKTPTASARPVRRPRATAGNLPSVPQDAKSHHDCRWCPPGSSYEHHWTPHRLRVRAIRRPKRLASLTLRWSHTVEASAT